MDNERCAQFLHYFEIHTCYRCHIYLIELLCVRAGVMLNVKWQERTTTTEIVKVSWSMSIKTMFVDDMCRDAMTEGHPRMFGMVNFMA